MNPFSVSMALFQVGVASAQMLVEAQAVITMRLWGMAGLWSVTPAENMRMLTEKPVALSRAGSAAAQAAMRGATPDKVAEAWIRPITRRARANRRRLAKRGPAIGRR